jgi:BTB/POZ domain
VTRLIQTSFATSEIITVYVGQERTAYKLHKDLLISKSPYFRASLSSCFPEGRTFEVHLAEDVPAAFDIFVQWLYSGSVSPIKNEGDVNVKTRAYIMADALLVSELKNDLMDRIRKFYIHNWMGSKILTMLAEKDTFHGQLKRFALDQLAYDLLASGDLSPQPSFYSPGGGARSDIDAFLAGGSSTATETFWALRNCALEQYDNPATRKGCHYHKHPAGSPACNSAARKDKGETW